jgi:YVTN family beta-propeller protein
VGSLPISGAINIATIKSYVGNFASQSVSVIDGTTNSVEATLPVETPLSIAGDPATNQIYAGDQKGIIVIIDGATNATTPVVPGGAINAIALNPVDDSYYAIPLIQN